MMEKAWRSELELGFTEGWRLEISSFPFVACVSPRDSLGSCDGSRSQLHAMEVVDKVKDVCPATAEEFEEEARWLN